MEMNLFKDDSPIGPNPCHICGGEYGEHASDCRAQKRIDLLTNDELNVEVCKWLGWTHVKLSADEELGQLEEMIWQHPNGTYVRDCYLPNYITGIEALGHMHEAILKLDDKQKCQFNGELMRVFENETFCLHNTINATARQRCIALLRVVNPSLFT